jgi:hypothetical protein
LNILIGKYGENKVEYLINKLQRIAGVIDYEHDSNGLGIFLSKNILRVVKFPFEVREKVFVGDEFETRDLVYTTKSLFDYYFLVLSNKTTRLFRGYGEMINEIIDENFPKEPVALEDESDKSICGQRGLRTYFMNVDYILFLYLNKNTRLFVSGSNEDLAIFRHITKYSRNIAGFAEVNNDRLDINEINDLIKCEIKKYVEKENEKLIVQFQQLIGSGRIFWGISEVWKAAADAKVMTLLVEKDYMCPAIVSADSKNLFFDSPSGANGNHAEGCVLDDAVNDLINMVINKGGDIVFVDNGKLTKYDKLAAVLK